MSYVTRNLLDGETVAYSTKLHWKIYIAPILAAVFIFLPLAYFALRSPIKLLALLPLALILVFLVPAYLRRASSEFAATDKRVIMKVGVFSSRSVELLPGKVEGIAVTQSFMGRLLNYGDIVVTGSGGTKESFSGIEAPLEFRRAVQSVTDQRI